MNITIFSYGGNEYVVREILRLLYVYHGDVQLGVFDNVGDAWMCCYNHAEGRSCV